MSEIRVLPVHINCSMITGLGAINKEFPEDFPIGFMIRDLRCNVIEVKWLYMAQGCLVNALEEFKEIIMGREWSA